MIHHLFEMSGAQNGLGIVSHNSKVTKKLGKHNALFTGTFEECHENKLKFMNHPELIRQIHAERDKVEQKKINTLLKKHK